MTDRRGRAPRAPTVIDSASHYNRGMPTNPTSPVAAPKIRATLPPGGYANAVGVYLAAFPAELLLHAAEIEGRWIHRGIGGQAAAPPPPPATAPLETLFAHLDAVRKTSAAILKPLVERDLDTLRVVEGKEGKSTVRRILFDLVAHQAHHRGQMGMLARLLS